MALTPCSRWAWMRGKVEDFPIWTFEEIKLDSQGREEAQKEVKESSQAAGKPKFDKNREQAVKGGDIFVFLKEGPEFKAW